MSVEKTIVWENEKWSLTEYFDDVWKLKSKGGFKFLAQPELDIALDHDEIATLVEILREVSL